MSARLPTWFARLPAWFARLPAWFACLRTGFAWLPAWFARLSAWFVQRANRVRAPAHTFRRVTNATSAASSAIAGVCVGLAQYFGMDVTTVRLVAAVLLLFTHVAIVPISLILWIVMPEASAAEAPRYDPSTGQPLP